MSLQHMRPCRTFQQRVRQHTGQPCASRWILCILHKGLLFSSLSCSSHMTNPDLLLLCCFLLLPSLPARETVQTIGNSVYFNVPNNHELHMNLGGGAEAWAGYKQAVKPCQIGLSFNIDLAATAFMSSGPLPTVVANMLNLRGGENELSRSFGQREHRTIKTALKGLRVRGRWERQDCEKGFRGESCGTSS